MQDSLSPIESQDLPDDCIFHIFSFLDYSDLIRVGLVCKTWYNISLNNELWKKFFKNQNFLSDLSPGALRRRFSNMYRSWHAWKDGISGVHILKLDLLPSRHNSLKMHRLKITPDCGLVVTTDKLGIIRIWNKKMSKISARFAKIKDGFRNRIHRNDGEWATIQCKAFDLTRGFTLSDILLSNCGKKIITASANRKIEIWQFDNDKLIPLQTLKSHRKGVTRLKTLDDSLNNFISASFDNCLISWKYNQRKRCYKQCSIFNGHNSGVWNITLYNSNIFASTSYDSTAKVWDITTAQCTATTGLHPKGLTSVCFTPSYTLCTGTHTDLFRWDLKSGNLIKTMKIPHKNYINRMKIDQDDQYLIACSIYGFYIFDLRKNKILYSIETSHDVKGFHWLQNENGMKMILAWGCLGNLSMWDFDYLSTQKPLWEAYYRAVGETGALKIIGDRIISSGQVVAVYDLNKR